MSVETVVIVGAGQAGYQTAASLRQKGFTGTITLVNGEAGLPYQRPPLSKAYLLGKLDASRLPLRQGSWYTDQRVDLIHDEAVSVDRHDGVVVLRSGTRLRYDHLVLATGARNRTLEIPGSDVPEVIGMRSQADADRLAPLVVPGTRVVVVGAGFIGLEFASVAAHRGASVHVLDLADRPMARAVSEPVSRFFQDRHQSWGVTFGFGEGVTRIKETEGHVTAVVTTTGRVLPADLVVYGIGVLPNAEIAREAGLRVDNGIVVNADLLTSDPDISAIGDAACFPCAQLGYAPTRLESVQNAADQARHVAARLIGATADGYGGLAWFWSDQGDLKLQIAGLADGYEDIVELPVADEDTQKFVLCFRGDELASVETVNLPGEHMSARRLLSGASALPTPSDARSPGFDLTAWGRAIREPASTA